MSEEFDKDGYGDYFAELEKQIESGKGKNADRNMQSAFSSGDVGGNSFKHERIAANTKKTQKRRRVNTKGVALLVVCVVLTAALIITAPMLLNTSAPETESVKKSVSDAPKTVVEQEPEEPQIEKIVPIYNESTVTSVQNINSESFIFMKLSDKTVSAALNPKQRMYPASTTKIMTLLVAVENIENMDDTYIFTNDFLYSLYREQSTVAGFLDGEEATMLDMLYGLILPSGGDAAIGLARKISGSEENFVRLMNEKAEELGLKDTNFTNVTGLYDQNHYTTVEDMAVILAHTIKDETCKKILSTYQYTSAPTNKHPEGLPMTSTLFSYMYGTEPQGSDITGGKTGFTNESRYCIASFGKSETTEEEFICVTFKAPSKYPAVYDHINLFTAFGK